MRFVLNQFNNKIVKILVAVATLLFTIILLGFAWLGSMKQEAMVGGTFSFMALLAFTSGLSTVISPCTLPLLSIIMPLAMGKNYLKGILMALFFGFGLSLTITIYGIAMAYLGEILGVKAATPWLILIAGAIAYFFGLSELSFFKIQLPFFSTVMPKKLQLQGDYIRSFFLGLLLGNAGIGCPSPFFYVLLFYIVGTANIFSGAILGFIHGMGRALPIIFLTILAMLGYQSTKMLLEYRTSIASVAAWLLIVIGAFLVPVGLFDMRGWWFLDITRNWFALFVAIILLLLPLLSLKYLKKTE